MTKKRLFVPSALLTTVLCFILQMPNAWALNEKVSLKELVSQLREPQVIEALFKKSAENDFSKLPKALGPLWLKNKDLIKKIETHFASATSFQRGEIEDGITLNGLMLSLQLSLMKSRELAYQNQWKEMQEHFQTWFLFAADFPYEESSLVSLRLAGVIRSLLFDELERIQKNFAAEIAKTSDLRKWFLTIRAPWPVDRVLISEAKRRLSPVMMSVANSVAQSYQKNPYQTSADALKKVKGGDASEAELLKQIWRESDISMMKGEMNRIGLLKIRLGLAEFQSQTARRPADIQELVKAGYLDQAPIDYETGKPLDLTSL